MSDKPQFDHKNPRFIGVIGAPVRDGYGGALVCGVHKCEPGVMPDRATQAHGGPERMELRQ
jgi:hypothetical protein